MSVRTPARRLGGVLAAGALGATASLGLAMAPAAAGDLFDISVYAGMPGNSTVTIPAGVCFVDWTVIGAGGGATGGGDYTGGKGGEVRARTAVQAGDTFLLQPGHKGTDAEVFLTAVQVPGGPQATSAPGLVGGKSGDQASGGDSSQGGAAGGGATIVRKGTTTSSPAVVIAGGGGGAGGTANGGDAGAVGHAGAVYVYNSYTYGPGAGGTASAGGAGGTRTDPGNGRADGLAGAAGRGGSAPDGGAGAGGGGLFGGGSGASEGSTSGAGGGGGSNLAPAGASKNATAVGTGDGRIEGTYVACTAPGTPQNVVVAAERSALAVSWQAPASGDPVASYRVTASPGSAGCTTTTLTCILGGEAGKTYTLTVTAITADGRSGPGASVTATAAVDAPTVPATVPSTELTLTTDKGLLTSVATGQEIVVLGTGFLPYSTATIVIYSTPTVLGTVTTDGSGNFSKPVTVPTALAAGKHTLVASGVAPDGTSRFMKMGVTVGAQRARLASTGADVGLPLVLGFTALAFGGGLVVIGRRRTTA